MTPTAYVVKIGGEVALDPDSVKRLFGALRSLGPDVSPVIVHGGGALATSIASQYGFTAEMVAGRRVTSAFDLQTILWSVCGEVNTRLVAEAQQHGYRAVGLSGADAGMVIATKRPPRKIDGRTIEFGFVGDIETIDAAPISLLLRNGYLPVVATLGIDDAGTLLNINADTVAARIASTLSAAALFLITPSGAVRRDADDPASALTVCTRALFDEGAAAGWIHGGMRVKLEEALRCRESGVERVIITTVDGIGRDDGTRIE